ncbi:secA translation cis-regulator SecM [Shimwellia blattae]|uniref:Secretion monitor n=1 Tax=Shimwellia blattae (strain ATCC 29907 / DSM 4481 / JCM 1650 / NBRC 105725 / CDC 9005-74) TaxID=630626 RepID=I2BCR8_SHIBC|nr:secA translation cis-regulator SecM [Shimwellia blattae]AFJ48322.1 secretion monitor precursor protein (SecM) [Shimwellia blattae DSM 4481 = NBRC 105725]GAB81016.1 secretion monitor [Shimwellia blattae DSM 4481 = NBRC 105725]VDY65816.1 Secretion monitor precursor [Shimwellia blattae]VEC25880.1 Secretion monitor precursor [Shimwellia blattae]
MIGILDRWRQLGRRYFWPHLLFGMVAASFGLPALSASAQTPAKPTETSAPSLAHRALPAYFDGLALLQESGRRASFAQVDYWHQHAIRTVIRHLSFALAPQALHDAEEACSRPHNARHFALLNSLSSLLTQAGRPPVVVRQIARTGHEPGAVYSTTTWISLVQGIRAGPLRFS